jgi:hypothetical protein
MYDVAMAYKIKQTRSLENQCINWCTFKSSAYLYSNFYTLFKSDSKDQNVGDRWFSLTCILHADYCVRASSIQVLLGDGQRKQATVVWIFRGVLSASHQFHVWTKCSEKHNVTLEFVVFSMIAPDV